MPRVPVAERQVQVGGLPTIRTTPDVSLESFGGGASQAKIGQATNNLVNVYQEEKQKANDAWSVDYYAKVAQKKQELTYDPNSGLITKKGKDSFTAPDDYLKQFDSYADSLEANATPEQRAMAQKIRQKERLEFNGSIMRHVAQESEKYQDDSVKNGIQVARNDAVLNMGNEQAIQDKINLQKSLYMQTASGKPPAVVEYETKQIESKTHAAVINRMLDGQMDREAKQYFDKYKGQLSGEDIDNVEKLLASATLAGESQRQADDIMKRTTSLSQAFEESKRIQDPKLRDETTKRVKDNYAMKNLADKEREENNSVQAANIIDKTGDTNKVPRSIWNTFSPSQRSSLESYAKHKREGTEPQTDWNEYYNLKNMASAPALRDEFLRTNLMNYRDKLGNSEFKELVNAQQGLRKGDEKTEKLLDGYRSDAEIVNSALSQIGIDPTPKPGSKDATKVSQFRRKVEERIVALQSSTGKKATNKEIQEIVDSLTIEGVTQKGFFFDDKKRAFELDSGEAFQEVKIKDIPQSDRQKIEASLRKYGKAVNDANIIKYFTLKNIGS